MHLMPTKEEADKLLQWAGERNPGPWVNHSKTAANAASLIGKSAGMDETRCYVLGLLHDIGRYEGKTHLRHTIAGYELLMDKGWQKPAEICLSHSFPIKGLDYFIGTIDCPEGMRQNLQLLLEDIPYDDEIRLIQLCDALCMPERVTLMEQRLVDVAIRHGATPYLSQKWRVYLDIKKYFDQKCGFNIYLLFLKDIQESIFM